MSIELHMLLLAVALTLAAVLIAVLGAMMQVGMPALAGSRQGLPESNGWAGPAHPAGRAARSAHIAICSKTWCCSRRWCWWVPQPGEATA